MIITHDFLMGVCIGMVVTNTLWLIAMLLENK